jgi:HEAT repeat protein
MRAEESLFRSFYRAAYARLPTSIRRGLPTPQPEIFGLRGRTLFAIGAIGPSSVPRLLPVLRDRANQIRWIAAAGIGMVGHGLDGPVAALIPLAKDPDPSVRAAAIEALARMGQAKKAAIPVVVDALQHGPSRQVRSAAAWALLGIGPDAAGSVLGAWRGALSDSGPSTRQWAAIGLWRTTGDARSIRLLIQELETATDDETWQRILPVLGQAGGLSKTAVPTIAAKLAKVETTGQPSGDEGLSLLLREVLCQIDPEAVE